MIETLFPPHDALIWQTLTLVILAISALSIVYFLIKIGEGLQLVWTDDFVPWWKDRRARRMRKRMAQVDADMAAYRAGKR